MGSCKFPDIGYPVCHLPADGVIGLECDFRRDMPLYVFHDVLKSVQRLCGLGVETDVFVEIQFPCLFRLFDDDGLSGGLSYQPQYFSVSILP